MFTQLLDDTYTLCIKAWNRILRNILPPLHGARINHINSNYYLFASAPLPSGPLRVCLYITTLFAGGAERQVVFLARALARRGHEVHVLCEHGLKNANTQFLAMLWEYNVTVEEIPRLKLLANLRFCRSAGCVLSILRCLESFYRPLALGLCTYLLRHKIQVLHCYLDGPNIIGGISGLMARVPVIRMSARSVSPAHPAKAGSAESLTPLEDVYGLLLSFPQISLEANSRAGAEDYAQWLGCPIHRIAIIPNGIPVDFITTISQDERTRLRESLGLPEHSPVLIAVQRSVEVKRPLMLIRVLARVRKVLPQVRLMCVGGGPMLEQMKALCHQLHQEDAVLLLGDRNDIPALLQISYTALLTSRVEGLPNALLEAMLARLPVVATRAGGVADLVEDGVHGRLVNNPEEDTEENLLTLEKEMSESILQLLLAPEKALRIGQVAYQHIVEEFSDSKLAEKAEAAYRIQAPYPCPPPSNEQA